MIDSMVHLLQGEGGVAAAVIELDALADAVGAAAEDHDFLAIGWVGFAGGFVGGVEVGREAFEFGGAGIDAVEDGLDAQSFAAFRGLRVRRRSRSVPSWASEMPKRLARSNASCETASQSVAASSASSFDTSSSWSRNQGSMEVISWICFHGVAVARRRSGCSKAVGRGRDQFLRDQVCVEVFGAEGFAGFEAADAFPQGLLEGAADGHDFADRFHLGAERGVGAGEFFELPTWES